jgi:hypothetical protein
VNEARRRRLAAGRRWALAGGASVAFLAAAGSASALTISPLPGTPAASPRTQISFLGAPAASISSVSVVGSQSGSHAGKLEPYTTATGASFVLSTLLDEGEHVTVTAKVAGQAVGTQFTVAHWVTYHFNPPSRPPSASSPSVVQAFASAPSLHPPSVQVSADSPASTPGDVFVGPNEGAGQWGPMIFNQQGQLVWFDPMPPGTFAMDLRVQPYRGASDLTWWQGYISSIGVGFGIDEIYDSHYRRVATVRAGNGYSADLHEIDITPQGSAFITAYTLIHTDLSAVGGSREGTLLDPIIQEIDIPTGLVMFEWDPFGHIRLQNSYTHPVSPNTPWDWFHANSISLGPDGNMLIDARNTWAAYDVSLQNGQVLWRLGGKSSTFKLGPYTGVAYQHDAEWQPDHTITIFDDGASPVVHPQSRTVRLALNWSTRTVSLVNQMVHTPKLLSPSQGNDQVLADGNSMVGWGQEGYFTEFSPTGQTLFDAHFPTPGQSYRAYLFPWSATPATPPALAIKPAGTGKSTIYASWNGATAVAAWRVLAGPNTSHLTQAATALKAGFETAIPVSTTGPVFAIQALALNGTVLGTATTSTH